MQAVMAVPLTISGEQPSFFMCSVYEPEKGSLTKNTNRFKPVF